MTSAVGLARAGILQFTDHIWACVCGTRTAFSNEGHISGLFKELSGVVELILFLLINFSVAGERFLPGFDKVACNFLLSPEGGTCTGTLALKTVQKTQKVETMAGRKVGQLVPLHYSLLIAIIYI